MAPFPSFTKTFHDDTYPAIDPTKRPELTLKGKKVVISGGGAGIGRGLTHAFAQAGAASIAILGRRSGMLLKTKAEVEGKHSDITITTHSADIVDAASVEKAAKEIGSWDILISNAGYLSSPSHLVDSDPTEWWRSFEVVHTGQSRASQSLHIVLR